MAKLPQPRAGDTDRGRGAAGPSGAPTTAGADPQELLEVACEAALRAGARLRERFARGRETRVSSKSTPTDPVSEADLESQHTILALIAERRPGDGFVAEEEAADRRGESGLRWVVDPLDGTVNYLYGIPQWCVSIAVRDGEGTLAGVVHDPIAGDTFSAVRGELPSRNGERLAHRGADSPALARSLVATGFAYDAQVRSEQGRLLARMLPAVRDIRRFGSAALDLAWTAMGRWDAYYERGVKPWDIAAGVLVCECVGLVAQELGGGILVAPAPLAPQLAALIAGAED